MRLDRRAFTGAVVVAALELGGGAGRLAAGPIRRLFDGTLLLATSTIYSMWLRGRIVATPLMMFAPLLESMRIAFGMTPACYSRCRRFNGTLLGRLRALVTLPARIRRARMEAAILAHEIECQQMFLAMFAAEQVKRFQQILLQMKGAMAVADAETQKLLTLTDDQKQRVGTIIADYEKKMTAGADDTAAAELLQAPKLTQLKEERDAKINEVLTPEQKAKLGEMQGEPFGAIHKLLKEPLNPSLLAGPEEIPAPAAETPPAAVQPPAAKEPAAADPPKAEPAQPKTP